MLTNEPYCKVLPTLPLPSFWQFLQSLFKKNPLVCKNHKH